MKHQITLPNHNHITKILIRELHSEHGHAGQSALLSNVQQSYWPIQAKTIIRQITHECVHCFKICPKSNEQYMGNLPFNRVQLLHPFNNCSVDYAGPLLIKINRRTQQKVYICIFVCMAVKAIHIELVSELTTNAFTAALTRFISRRGICSNIYSDNGSNFVGASNEYAELNAFIKSTTNQEMISKFCTMQQIQFHFIPPRSPHFGGLWEASVKSVKYYLRRIIGKTSLNFEELSTVLAKIEQSLIPGPCLQSRMVQKISMPSHLVIF